MYIYIMHRKDREFMRMASAYVVHLLYAYIFIVGSAVYVPFLVVLKNLESFPLPPVEPRRFDIFFFFKYS